MPGRKRAMSMPEMPVGATEGDSRRWSDGELESAIELVPTMQLERAVREGVGRVESGGFVCRVSGGELDSAAIEMTWRILRSYYTTEPVFRGDVVDFLLWKGRGIEMAGVLMLWDDDPGMVLSAVDPVQYQRVLVAEQEPLPRALFV